MPSEPQSVASDLTRSAIFLVVTLHEGGDGTAAARGLLADMAGLVRAVGFRDPAGLLSCVTGIGSAAWDRLFPGPRPKGLHVLEPLDGVHHAPSTPGDLLFHIRAMRMDMCFELAHVIMDRIGAHVTVQDETHGFKFFDNRDLLGFVDGTENPNGPARSRAVLIGDEDPAFAGGSYVITQKYMHDLAKWDRLPIEQQERIIGRKKLSDIELPDAEKPSFAHNVLNVITDEDGNQLDILRDNMPFGRPGSGEFGTYFIGYACDPARTERMLRNMFLGDPPGNYDRILDFSTAVTGTLFFVPPADMLDAAADTPSDETPATASLGIGSLKGN